jgi:hypothetical protein
MSECPRCGRPDHRERDFCACGEYLGFRADDATRAETTAPPAGAGAEEMVSPPRLDMTFVGDAPDRLSVEPGAAASMHVRIRNQGEVTEHFDVVVNGIPTEWWAATPPRVRLNPWGKGHPCEQDVVITLRPPRSPEATARDWPLRIEARRVRFVGEHGADGHAELQAVMTIEPFSELTVALRGDRGRPVLRRGVHTLEITHRGNRPVACDVRTEQVDPDLSVRAPAEAMRLDASGQARVAVPVRLRRFRWFGTPVRRPFAMTVRERDGGAHRVDGAQVQRALIPVSPSATGALVAVLAAAGAAAVPALLEAGSKAAATQSAVTPAPQPTETPSTAPTPEPEPEPGPTETPTPEPTPSPTPTATPTPTPEPEPEPIPSVTAEEAEEWALTQATYDPDAGAEVLACERQDDLEWVCDVQVGYFAGNEDSESFSPGELLTCNAGVAAWRTGDDPPYYEAFGSELVRTDCPADVTAGLEGR